MSIANVIRTPLNIAYSFLRAREMPRSVDILILLLLFGFSFFYGLGQNPLVEPDEARYAEIPREMIELSDFVTPHLNYVKYFDKPPLYYWLNVLSLHVFGHTEFAVRFFSSLAGLAGILLTWFIARKLYGRRAGLLSALILGTSVGYLVQGRLNIIDMTLTCLMTSGLGFLLLASREGEPRAIFYYHLSYACMALAVLAKGPIGVVLPAGIFIIYLFFSRRWKLLKELRLATGTALFLLICAPWFILVSVRNPEFVRFFFVREHLVRFLTTSHHRYEPFWFFIPVLFGCMFPWSCFFPAAASRVIRKTQNTEHDSDLFLAVWAGAIILFYSLSASKLVTYILPAFPAMAILTGKTLSALMDEGCRSFKKEARFLQVILLSGAAAVFSYPLLGHTRYLSAVGGAVYALLLLVEALFVTSSIRNSSMVCLLLGLCLMTHMEGVVGPNHILHAMIRERSVKELALIVKERARPEDKVCTYGFYAQDLPFYTERRVICVDVGGDLEFGSMQGDQSSWFLGYSDFYRLWDSEGRLFTLIDEDDIEGVREKVRTPIRFLGQEGDRLLIFNR